uniref:Uncharacterized protein n=1 Tax=Anopheles albimanus TaxID=7167 RepID=A0A182FTU5_ANOAL
MPLLVGSRAAVGSCSAAAADSKIRSEDHLAKEATRRARREPGLGRSSGGDVVVWGPAARLANTKELGAARDGARKGTTPRDTIPAGVAKLVPAFPTRIPYKRSRSHGTLPPPPPSIKQMIGLSEAKRPTGASEE